MVKAIVEEDIKVGTKAKKVLQGLNPTRVVENAQLQKKQGSTVSLSRTQSVAEIAKV